jgi:folate-dependent phosphoribosylglycinamide formyltransferase PurN
MKIGLLISSNLTEFARNTLKPIIEDSSFSVKVAIIDNRPKKSIKQKLIKNIKRGRGGYIFIMAFQSLMTKEGISISTQKYCNDNNIEVIETQNPYSSETIEEIKKYGLDVLLLIDGYGIIKKPLINLTLMGILSYHHGNMRKYRGMPPAFWELYNNEKEMGVSVQILDIGLDTGIPIEEKTIEIRPKDSLKTLSSRAYKESENMMHNALKKLSNPNFEPDKIENFGEIYTLPNIRQWIMLNIKILCRKLQ